MQSESKNNELIKVKAYFDFALFPKTFPTPTSKEVVLGLNGSHFAITKWDLIDTVEGEPVTDRDSKLLITGEFNEPIKIGQAYSILAKYTEHPKYGPQYQLIYINEDIDFSKLNNQKAFLRTFLTDGQIAEFYKIYDNPIEILEKGDPTLLTKIHGVGDYISHCILDRYDKNKDYSTVYTELDGYGLTPAFIQKLVRVYKSSNALITAIKENPYQLIDAVDGVGFLTADKIALQGGMKPTAINRLKAYIQYYLRKEANDHGNSYVTAGELLTNIYEFFGGRDCIIEEIEDEQGNTTINITYAIQQLQDSDIIHIEEGENKSRRRVYLTEIYNLEKDIAKHLTRLLQAENKFNYNDWQINIAKLEEEQGFPFSEEQRNGIKLALDSQVCVISGLSGSGKTSLISGILAALPYASFAQAALSGKAGARMTEVTGVEGKTIHRLLEYNPGLGFGKNERNPLSEDIIIIDEISMVGGDIFIKLLEAIPNGTKLIMVGDPGQLPAITSLNLAHDMLDSPIIPSVKLTQIHRQAKESGIISTAHEIRSGYPIFENTFEGRKKIGTNSFQFLDISSEREYTKDTAIKWYKHYFNSPLVKNNAMNIQLIAPVRERGDASVYELNKAAQAIANPLSDSKNTFAGGTKDHPFTIQEGDKIMNIKNNYRVFDTNNEQCAIFNGWTGIVEHINQTGMIIYFPVGKCHVALSNEVVRDSIILGYAATCHKWQGSECPVVIVVLDFTCPPSMLSRQWLYTALTRASKECILVGQNAAINQAIATDQVVYKRTFLPELLLKEGG